MFEKEAEEYVNKDTWLFETARQDAKYHFQQGAEFGYNKANKEIKLLKETHRQSIDILVEQIEELHKANEWHYVKDGDLPKDKKDMLMSEHLILLTKLKGTDYLNIALGQYNFSTQEFSYQHIVGLTDVIAWKEIVLPKEIKE